MHFCGKIRVIRKCTERIDCRMDEDAWNQTSAAVKNRDQQKADRDRKNDLAQILDQIHTTAVEQVDDMPDAEGHAGNNYG